MINNTTILVEYITSYKQVKSLLPKIHKKEQQHIFYEGRAKMTDEVCRTSDDYSIMYNSIVRAFFCFKYYLSISAFDFLRLSGFISLGRSLG